MEKIKILGFIITILFGVFLVVYGGIDDSPGGQLLGIIMVIIGIVSVIRRKKKNSD